ncbi:hypothetical protein HGRIS_012240 [Hohenbuehelia grisea]|uniref:Uncharacterized protein n=1 Tax=Hohenbuehelia grisea TaxID=104357 RepID=A0ABR3IRN2_9AGAR
MAPLLPQLKGTVPGQLDPLQRQRLLRVPDSSLAFACFDPYTADASASQKRPLGNDIYVAKRVVLEAMPNGDISWRFVPKARLEDGASDEGVWPRIVSICGELLECSQEQWDIYKLDPAYNCYVRAVPNLTLITKATSISPEVTRSTVTMSRLPRSSIPKVGIRYRAEKEEPAQQNLFEPSAKSFLVDFIISLSRKCCPTKLIQIMSTVFATVFLRQMMSTEKLTVSFNYFSVSVPL